MSKDYFHLVVQHRLGYWRVVASLSMNKWQREQNISDWKRANKKAKHAEAPEFDTIEKALDYCDTKGYTEFGHVVINYEDYYE